jgi:hypothetical protein
VREDCAWRLIVPQLALEPLARRLRVAACAGPATAADEVQRQQRDGDPFEHGRHCVRVHPGEAAPAPSRGDQKRCGNPRIDWRRRRATGQRGNQVVGGTARHRTPRALGGAADVRQSAPTLGSSSSVGCTSGSLSNTSSAGGGDSRSRNACASAGVVDDAAARDVGQRGARLHQCASSGAPIAWRLCGVYGTTNTR